MKKLFLLLALLIPQFAFSNGLVMVQGKLTSIGESQYVIETAKTIVYIRRKKVPADQAAKLEKTGVNVSVALPFSAIDTVKKKKPSS